MGANKKQDFRSYPASTGFIRATPPRVTQDSVRSKIIRAYRKQASLSPVRPENLPGNVPAPSPLQDITSPEDVNLEDLLDSDREAA
ncbi:MAG TPA: hypothetical protein PL182_08715 [Pseudobdellovibrionaceae bacterium]|nr:hypothetical protein [Pseudobdellovibrionaceae bacterium]